MADHVGTEQAAEFSEEDLQDFLSKLDEFREGLPEDQKALLEAMIVKATGVEDEAEGGDQPAQESAKPDDEAARELERKLNAFHDELPGEQHRLVDALVIASTGDDVEAHHGIGFPGGSRLRDLRYIYTGQLVQYGRACNSIGGHTHVLGSWPGYNIFRVGCYSR